VNPNDRRYVIDQVNRSAALTRKQILDILLATTPRRATFVLTDIATGTGTTQAVTWTVPIPSDYAVTVSPTCAAAAVGLLTGGVQVGSKTTTGCTIVIANRTGNVLAAATFDVLAFPL